MPAIAAHRTLPSEPSEEGHLQFMRRRLQQASSGWSGRRLEDSELIAEGPNNAFWELIGVRIEGHPGVILGAVDFRRQNEASGFARQSLPSYLALNEPLSEGAGSGSTALLKIEVALETESVPEFLRQLTGKSSRHSVMVDKDSIQFAFDLRAENPSIERRVAAIDRMRQTVVLRTRKGHVLSGDLLDIEQKLAHDLPFFALTMGVQHTVHGNIPLPTVFIHRRSISMLSRTTAVEQLEDRLYCLPFRLENANPLHVLLEG